MSWFSRFLIGKDDWSDYQFGDFTKQTLYNNSAGMVNLGDEDRPFFGFGGNTDGSASGDSSATASTVLDFENMTPAEISNYAQTHQDFYQNNAALFDYWLNEKSYYARRNSEIGDYMNQLKENGINPILAYQFANGGMSGGASSGSSDYFAALNSAEASKSNAQTSANANILRGLMVLAGVGLSILLKNPSPLLGSAAGYRYYR